MTGQEGKPAELIVAILRKLIRGPDELAKLSTIRRKLANEKASIEAKLRSGAKDQLDATRDGLIKLRDTRLAVTRIREEMVNVERLCEDPKMAVEGFAKISEVLWCHCTVLPKDPTESLTWFPSLICPQRSREYTVSSYRRSRWFRLCGAWKPRSNI